MKKSDQKLFKLFRFTVKMLFSLFRRKNNQKYKTIFLASYFKASRGKYEDYAITIFYFDPICKYIEMIIHLFTSYLISI